MLHANIDKLAELIDKEENGLERAFGIMSRIGMESASVVHGDLARYTGGVAGMVRRGEISLEFALGMMFQSGMELEETKNWC